MTTPTLPPAARIVRQVLTAGPLCFALLTGMQAGRVRAADANPPLSVINDKAAGQITVSRGEKPLLVYAFAPSQLKPYVKSLYSLRGEDVLLDAPADHLHHHGLMYAITVNGVNFWEEANDPGYQRSAEPPTAAVSIGAQGQPQVVISHRLYWVARTNAHAPNLRAAALLIENRTLTLGVIEAEQEVSLQWQSQFSVGPAAAQATLTGSSYHGLGVRFSRSWDRTARHLFERNDPAEPAAVAAGQQIVVPSGWSAVVKPGDNSQTVALFASPQNPGPSRFFAMVVPFAYLSATQGLNETPIAYRPGDTWKLQYLVTVYPEAKDHAFLYKRHQGWIKNP